MRHGVNPQTGEATVLLFSYDENDPTMKGWFKGMEQIIWECGLWPETGLPAECPHFNALIDQTDCCCCYLLFNQADFVSQKSQLKELIEQPWPHL